MRSIAMRNPIAKLAIAAAIVAAVVLGLFEFIGSDGGSGVAWGEVIERLEASRGVILRRTKTSSNRPDAEDYRMIYSCPAHSRTDEYEANQITWSRYCDYSARTMVRIEHDDKRYFRHPMSEQ